MNTIADKDQWTKLWARSVQEMPRTRPFAAVIPSLTGAAAFVACGLLILAWFA